MKQPNWKLTLILSTSLFAVGTFTYWLQYSHKPKKDKAAVQVKKPIQLSDDSAQIALFKIKSDKGLIELKCNSIAEKTCSPTKAGSWTIAHPKSPTGEEYPADSSSVKEFLLAATNITATELIDLQEETPEKRKSLMIEYGLGDDQRTQLQTQFFEVILADAPGTPGKRLTMWFGTEHPIGDKTFVTSAENGTMNDQTVFLVSNQQKNSTFVKTLTDFRIKNVLSFDRMEITEFKAKGKFEAKKSNGLWTINGMEASYDRIETVLSGISNAKAIEFVDENLIRGLKPVLEYDLKTNDKSFSFALFEKKEGTSKKYYAKSSTQKETMEVDSLLRTNTDKSVNDLRNNILLTEAEKVTATQFKITSKTFKSSPSYQLKSGKWASSDASLEWNPELPSKIISQLTLSRIQEFKAPAPTGPELFRVLIGDDSQPTKFNYSMIQVKDKWYARNLNTKTNEAYLIEDTLKNAFPKAEDEWKIKKPTQ